MLSALKHFKDQTDPALPSRSLQPDVASEAGTWMGFPGGEGVSTVFTKSSLFLRITEMQSIKLIKVRKGLRELHGLSDTKMSELADLI